MEGSGVRSVLLVLVALSLIATTGCSGRRTSAEGRNSNINSVTLTEDGAVYSGPNASKELKTGKVPYSSPFAVPSAFQAQAGGKYVGKDGQVLVDFVKVEVPEHESWGGSTCAPPKRGGLCEVPFQGTVHSVGDANEIVFLAFENGATTPAAVRQIVAKQGFTRVEHFLTYRVGTQTRTVHFLVELRAPNGKVLAKNFGQTWGIYF